MELLRNHVGDIVTLVGVIGTAIGGYMVAVRNNKKGWESRMVDGSKSLIDMALEEADRVKAEIKDIRQKMKHLEQEYDKVIDQLKNEQFKNDRLEKENQYLKGEIKKLKQGSV